MATGPKIVHKQFNSPIGLYSQQNVQETLNKHLQNLDNGTVGIDFSKPTADKPTNLANSAVLRMLEEEERNCRGYPKLDPTQVQAILETMPRVNRRFDRNWPPERSRLTSARSWDGQLNTTGYIYPEFMKGTRQDQKKVVWPPLPETNGYHSPQQQRQPSPAYQNNAAQQIQQPSHQAPTQRAPQSPQPQYQQHQQPYPRNQQNQQSQPAFCEGRQQEACGLSKLIPVGPGTTARPVSPAPHHQGPQSPGFAPQPYRPAQGRWAPVSSPLSPQAYGAQPNYQQQHSPQQQQYSPQQQQYSPQPQQYSPQPQQYSPQQQQYQQQQYSPQQQQYSPQQQQYSLQQQQHSPQPQYEYQPPQKQFEPPPATITLRQQTPIHQKPSPVFASQPATASFKDSISSDPSSGGVNMRGDQKWPPQQVREAVAAENEARRQLAKGPACRPRKVKKDYRSFFAQNALNNNYPGYRAPPGTQHYEDLSGRSSY